MTARTYSREALEVQGALLAAGDRWCSRYQGYRPDLAGYLVGELSRGALGLVDWGGMRTGLRMGWAQVTRRPGGPGAQGAWRVVGVVVRLVWPGTRLWWLRIVQLDGDLRPMWRERWVEPADGGLDAPCTLEGGRTYIPHSSWYEDLDPDPDQ